MHHAPDDTEPQRPTADQITAWNRRTSEPENEAPAAVGFSAMLGRGDDTAVVLTGFRVYSTGVAFTLTVRLRKEPVNEFRHQVHELVSGHFSSLPANNLDTVLLLGIEYADGRKATNLNADWPDRLDPDGVEPLLRNGGGGGGGRTYEQHFWLSPVPPAGPLTFICRWPAFGIEETVTVRDGTEIAAARAQVETLWPWEPENDDEPDEEPPVPELPDGWFATALRH